MGRRLNYEKDTRARAAKVGVNWRDESDRMKADAAARWLASRSITDAVIESARSPAGGWTRATLAKWGVPWPPPKGWRKALVRNGLPYRP